VSTIALSQPVVVVRKTIVMSFHSAIESRPIQLALQLSVDSRLSRCLLTAVSSGFQWIVRDNEHFHKTKLDIRRIYCMSVYYIVCIWLYITTSLLLQNVKITSDNYSKQLWKASFNFSLQMKTSVHNIILLFVSVSCWHGSSICLLFFIPA